MTDTPLTYEAWRAGFEVRFRSMQPVVGSAEIHYSPSGRFSLETSDWSSQDGGWNYSRGIVRAVGSSNTVADVRRYYPRFWHAWVQQASGEYLVCGEDYQGYSVIDLERQAVATYFPTEGYKGHGFCWGAAYPSPDGLSLAVEGCYWACPYELVVVDFRNPMELPLPELARFDDLDKIEGWHSPHEFSFSVGEGSASRPVIWRRAVANEP
jgi:hypothetical protein